jgi:hypothetical protein
MGKKQYCGGFYHKRKLTLTYCLLHKPVEITKFTVQLLMNH